jgi:hypothetical protein
VASPAFRSKATGGNATAANVTVSVPAGVVDNDILLFFLSKDATGAVTWPAGWNILVEGTANTFYGGIGWRRASGEPANYTWTFASTWRDAIILAYSGAVTGENPNDPDVPPAQVEVSLGPSPSWATNNITTTTADTIAVAFHQNINITMWSAEPAGWTARQNAGANEVHVMDQVFAAAQTITGPTQSCGGSGGASKAYIVALQSVAAGGAAQVLLPPGGIVIPDPGLEAY